MDVTDKHAFVDVAPSYFYLGMKNTIISLVGIIYRGESPNCLGKCRVPPILYNGWMPT